MDAQAAIQKSIRDGAPFGQISRNNLLGSSFGADRASRSTDIIIFNKSRRSFVLTTSNCESGMYSDHLSPEASISGMQSLVYGVESNSFATGVECTTTYSSRDGSYFELTTSNPFIGSNSIRASHSPSLKLEPIIGKGNNNQVRWSIEDDILGQYDSTLGQYGPTLGQYDSNWGPYDPNSKPYDPNLKPYDPNYNQNGPRFRQHDDNLRKYDPNWRQTEENWRQYDLNLGRH